MGWYLTAFLIPFLLVALGYGLYLLLGGPPLDDWLPPSPISFVATFLFMLVLGGAQEEPGWRGFALPRLQARYNALVSSLILGALWAFWHVPVLFFVPGTIQSEFPPVWYLLLTLALTILFTWIFNHSRGSILPAMVFHAAVNTAPGLLPLHVEGDLIRVRDAVLMAAWLVALAVVAVFGPARLTRKSERAS
jgi:membrane protease YdiL (CAAX protease family)